MDDDLEDRALGALVGVLRQIHAAHTDPRPAERRLPEEGPAAVPGILGDLLGARDRRPRPGPGAGGAAFYEALHDHIRRAETAALARSQAVDRALGRAGNGGAPPAPPSPTVQETVYLQCGAGGRTAGRFRCVNRTGRRAEARVRAGGFARGSAGPIDGARLSLDPDTCTLDTDEAAVITVAVDLRACTAMTGQRIEGWADVEVAGAVSLKVWIVVDLYAPGD